MASPVRPFLSVGILIFFIAALIHFEVLMDGYPDRSAGIAESVIGVVLLIGLVLTFLFPALTRTVGIAVQTFALLGTLVGLTLLITVGPGTTLDLVIHLVMILVLIIGLVVTMRAPSRV
ncbi:MAG: hypothetical protein ACRDZM_09355 [Acidimicrobiia bacterium]